MSENLQNKEDRKRELSEIIGNLKTDQDIPKMKKRFSTLLKDLSPEEIAEAEQALIAEGVPVEDVQKLCEIHVAAFEDSLKKSSRRDKIGKILAGHPVDTYRRENNALKKLLKQLKRSIRKSEALGYIIHQISLVENHYVRKENQLFPFLEGVGFSGPSKVMWGKHDEIRELLKEINQSLESNNLADCRKKSNVLITSMKRMIFMEEKILFPTAMRKLPESTWKDIRRGENEIGYSWVKPGNLWDPDILPVELQNPVSAQSSQSFKSDEIDLSVGKLLPEQINLMLKNLPLDITYVDENDRVRYYSQGKERIFPRSPGIIGREVQNCHPPKSVHIVQKIVEDFKNGVRSEAEFWIQMGEKFIHIRYFPLFEDKVYRGVIEVSQDIAPLRALEGQKRLLDE